jgi:hypothetical protein
MQTRADELVESWINGNLTWVIEQVIGERSKVRSALMSALIFSQLDTGQRTVFLRMLKEAI